MAAFLLGVVGVDSTVKKLAAGEVPYDFECIKSFEQPYRDSMRVRGDLFLTPTGSSSLFYHAGVCCENKLIIHLTQAGGGGGGGSSGSSSASSSGEGQYMMTSVRQFRLNDGKEDKLMILRWKGRLPDDFDDRVMRAMESTRRYSLLFNNCITFALELIGYRK